MYVFFSQVYLIKTSIYIYNGTGKNAFLNRCVLPIMALSYVSIVEVSEKLHLGDAPDHVMFERVSSLASQ